jgi:hypothetical protein
MAGGTARLLITLLSLVLGGCSLFNSEPDTDVLAVIDQQVWEANAPRIGVHFNADSAAGLTVPVVSYEARQRIPFTVTYTPTNQDYAFVRWAASLGEFDTGVISLEELEKRHGLLNDLDIYIERIQDTTTQVTVLRDIPQVTLTPVLAVRPVVRDWQPDGGTSNPVIINTPIMVRFSKPIRAESFVYYYQGGTPRFRNDAGEFKNITIMGSADFGNGAQVSYARYFLDPQVTDTTLKLEVDIAYARAHPPSFSYLYVTLEQGIRSTDNQTLAAPVRFQYSINDVFDDTGPVIRRFSASLDGVTEAVDMAQRKVKPGDTVYLIITAFDQITRTDLHDVYITDMSSGAVERFWYVETLTNERFTALVDAVKYNYGGVLPGVFIFEYTIPAGAPGRMELQAEVSDTWGNRSAPVVFSLDRAAP